MSPGKISKRIAVQRIDWIQNMLAEIRCLPLADYQAFMADRRNVWTAESCLRRALEALMDLGRHVLAKGFGRGVTEYKEIAVALEGSGVLNKKEATRLRILPGHRNRMVHFYHEISAQELFSICASELADIENVLEAMKKWVNGHPEMLDETL